VFISIRNGGVVSTGSRMNPSVFYRSESCLADVWNVLQTGTISCLSFSLISSEPRKELATCSRASSGHGCRGEDTTVRTDPPSAVRSGVQNNVILSVPLESASPQFRGKPSLNPCVALGSFWPESILHPPPALGLIWPHLMFNVGVLSVVNKQT